MLKHTLIVLLCISCLAPFANAEPVCKIVDGDTFHLCNGFKVRLDGIDTPEKGEPFYWDARRGLAELIQTHDLKIFDCRLDKTKERFACKVDADGKDVQAELVKQGMAWDWPKYSKGRYAKQEAQAKAFKVGLWVDSKAEDIHWAKRSRK